MPRLVKGGKWVYGLSETGFSGKIIVPAEALDENGFKAGDSLIAMSASRTSGGFVLTDMRLLRQTVFTSLIEVASGLQSTGREAVLVGSRWLAGTMLESDHSIILVHEVLMKYGIRSGDRLVVVRGSWAGINCLVRGPIVEEANRHPELRVFYP